MSTVNKPINRAAERRVEAEERNKKWAALTTQQKLDALDARLGRGQGARYQREKLANQLKTEKELAAVKLAEASKVEEARKNKAEKNKKHQARKQAV